MEASISHVNYAQNNAGKIMPGALAGRDVHRAAYRAALARIPSNCCAVEQATRPWGDGRV